jgi:hypothetical protein
VIADEELQPDAAGDAEPSTRSPDPVRDDGPWWVAALLTIGAAVPVLAAAVRAGTSWMPLQDTAALVMRSRDVFTSSTPLLGMPTSLSATLGRPVHHPGPMGFWPSAVSQAIVDHPAAPMVATVLVNLACIAGIVFIARRLGGVPVAALAALLVALTSWSLRDELLIDPLNPNAGYLPLGLYLVAAVAVASGRAWVLPVMVVAGSYAAQSHVSLLAPVGSVGVALLAWGAWTASREVGARRAARGLPDVVRSHRGPVAVAAFLAVAAWLPVLIDLVAGNQNLWYLARAGGGTGEESLGLASTWDVVTRAIVSPGWLRDDRTAIEAVAPIGLVPHLAAVALLVMAVTLLIVLARRGHRSIPSGLLFSLAAFAGGGFGLTRIPWNFWNVFSFSSYLWLWAASAVFWASLVTAVAVLLQERLAHRSLPGLRLAGAAVCGLGVLVVAGAAVSSSSDRVNFSTQFSGPVAEISDQLTATLDPEQPYLVEIPVGIDYEFVPMGVALELERRGFDIVLPARLEGMVHSHRTTSDEPVETQLTFVQGLVLPAPSDEGNEVARFTPAADDQASLEDVEGEMMDLIEERGGLAVARGDVTEDYDLAGARQVVESGELLGLWQFGILTAPSMPDDLMVRYREALSLPVRDVVVYAAPTHDS